MARFTLSCKLRRYHDHRTLTVPLNAGGKVLLAKSGFRGAWPIDSIQHMSLLFTSDLSSPPIPRRGNVVLVGPAIWLGIFRLCEDDNL